MTGHAPVHWFLSRSRPGMRATAGGRSLRARHWKAGVRPGASADGGTSPAQNRLDSAEGLAPIPSTAERSGHGVNAAVKKRHGFSTRAHVFQRIARLGSVPPLWISLCATNII